MSTEQFQNLAASTAAGNINNSSNPVTFSVASGDGSLFPSTTNGSFRVTVSASDGTGAEVMLCTSRSSDALTCSRGSSATGESPTPTLLAHSTGDIVSHNVTAGGIKRIISDIIYGDPLTTPVTSTFSTAATSGGATSVSFTDDTSSGEPGMLLSANSNANDTNLVARMFAVPATPYSIRMRYRLMCITHEQYPLAGFCWSDGTKFNVFGNMSRNDSDRIRYCSFSSTTAFDGTDDTEYQSWNGWRSRAGLYDIMVTDNGTNRIMYVIGTGLAADKIQYKSVTRTSWLTPSLMGVVIAPGSNSNGGVFPVQMKIIDWTQS